MTSCVSIAVPIGLLAATAVSAAPRDVQIRSVNFAAGVVELYNFGNTTEPLDGWRFCTHDENQVRIYSGANGLNGFSIEAGTSFSIHLNNDAPGGTDSVNASTVGNFAGPLDNGPYGMQIYFSPVQFANGMTIADHVQWSIGGVANAVADERSDEAVAGGVWTDLAAWVPTAVNTESIVLLDETGGVLHGPADYMAVAGGGGCPGEGQGATCENCDVDGDGVTNGLDIAVITNALNFGFTVDAAIDPCADTDGSGVINGLDVSECTNALCFGI